MRKRFCLLAALAIALLFPAVAFAEPADNETDEDLKEEIERQIRDVDLSGWDEFFDEFMRIAKGDPGSAEELLLSCAEGGASSPEDLYSIIRQLLKNELKRALAAAAALCAAAMITVLPAVLTDEGIRPAFGLALSVTAITLAAGAYAALCRKAFEAVGSASKLTEASMPIMCTLLVSIGSSASAGVFRPLMLFLSGTVIAFVAKAALPLCAAGGIVCIADSVTPDGELANLASLIKSAVKWLLGIISALYFGMTVMQGLTMAAKDGVTVRTAKFAIGKLVPVVGNMVSGTVDSIMGCALLVKNGAGTVAMLFLLAILIRPLAVLGAGTFIFRTAAALSQPAADARIVRLYSGIADMTAQLFACVAVTGCMLALTVLVFIASGGLTAGLW